MCYTGECKYETYPWGVENGCFCGRPEGAICSLIEDEEYEQEHEKHEQERDKLIEKWNDIPC